MRDKDWVEYHAESLADLVDDSSLDEMRLKQAAVERKAINLWQDGYHEKSINAIQKYLDSAEGLDLQSRGWLKQLIARIASSWQHHELAETYQQQAYADNRNLLRPKELPPYRPISVPQAQAESIVAQISKYRFRKGFLQSFEDVCSYLHHNSSAGQFEQALADLALMIGIASERHDHNGEGPDVL